LKGKRSNGLPGHSQPHVLRQIVGRSGVAHAAENVAPKTHLVPVVQPFKGIGMADGISVHELFVGGGGGGRQEHAPDYGRIPPQRRGGGSGV